MLVRMARPVVWVTIGIALSASVIAAPLSVRAAPQRQDEPSEGERAPATGSDGLPEIGDVIVDDPLTTSPNVIPLGICRTGRASGEQVGEGVIVKVRGRCQPESTTASVGTVLTGLTIPDGELRFEAKAVTGHFRAVILVFVRGAGRDNYSFTIDLAALRGGIGKNQGDSSSRFAEQRDLAGRVRRDDWNQYTIGLQGPRLWLKVNGELVEAASDETFGTGAVSLAVARIGDVNDEAETAVVFRNLRVSRLAGGPDDRAPTYQRPTTAPAAPGAPTQS